MSAPGELLSNVERRALDAIDLDGLIETLCELIAFESLGGQETAAQEHMATMMSEAGMEVDAWELDLEALYRDPACTVEIERRDALGVVGRAGGEDGGTGRCLVLNGHVDVVPAGEIERWSVPPWRGTVRDGCVYGRGAADMKGGLCCALFAIRALREAGVATAGTVLLHSVVGEEDGGLGTLAAIRRGHVGDGAIVLEPTELVVAPAHAGAFNFRITVPGLAAHGALRDEGVGDSGRSPRRRHPGRLGLRGHRPAASRSGDALRRRHAPAGPPGRHPDGALRPGRCPARPCSRRAGPDRRSRRRHPSPGGDDAALLRRRIALRARNR